ncbi:Inner membrane transport protein ynfM [Raoultella terrigena]|uniref:Inner membrane transport protein ynfM n=1 Tax=Raoultella terrigena TaxID=577 RepID=A0A485CGP8_RAOTE|nr:Inner membrane transport protein ynfM [Raoultella terrigena]
MSGRVFATLMMEQVSLNVIFMLFGGLLIFMALYVLYFLPASKNFTPSTALNLTQMLKGGIEHFKNRNISLAYVIGFILFGSFTSIFNFVAFYLHREPFNLSFTHIGLIPVSFALTFFSAPTTARLAVRFGAMNMLSMLAAGDDCRRRYQHFCHHRGGIYFRGGCPLGGLLYLALQPFSPG